jgi:uncharacterized protein
MTCPKCHGEMRQYERSGVTIDQCTECRGVFLDRGELEKLYEAEARWSAGPASSAPSGAPVPAPPPPAASQHYPAPQPGYHGHYRYRGHTRQRRHGSFLSNLFD